MTLPGLTGKYGTIYLDPPWQFENRTGKISPEHKRLRRYRTMSLAELMALPVEAHAKKNAHMYMWVPLALLESGLTLMRAYGFKYKTSLVWNKIRKDGGPDGRGCGFYFRTVNEALLFGVRGSLRTRKAGRRQVNSFSSLKREHSRKPDEFYDIIEACSYGPRLELFARVKRPGWTQWGDELETYLDRINGAVDGAQAAV